jgi:hypothetical protein
MRSLRSKASASGDANAVLQSLRMSERMYVLLSDAASEPLRQSLENLPASERVGQSDGLTQYRVRLPAPEPARLPVN